MPCAATPNICCRQLGCAGSNCVDTLNTTSDEKKVGLL